ncbi:hypothetical protein [Qipengyuania aurantiaca]|uniref:hypothetical protein n=1 Tax=Qipengyuania aurantiaca TaxID=2867233 RepID=UPI001FFDE81D|nr:hypothetical protein [Qipengyuania aurantiaca]
MKVTSFDNGPQGRCRIPATGPSLSVALAILRSLNGINPEQPDPLTAKLDGISIYCERRTEIDLGKRWSAHGQGSRNSTAGEDTANSLHLYGFLRSHQSLEYRGALYIR